MFKTEFNQHISKFSTSPFLFIGSGFSKRYYNLPDWETLLREMCAVLDLPKPFEYYKSNANSYLPQVAELMGVDFNSIWWSSERFKESRDIYKRIATTKLSPLKFEIASKIGNQNEFLNNDILDVEIRILKKINIDGIITTNWDGLLENLFSDYKPYIGQEELIFSDLYNIGEIYKIHGCVSDPNSLVLTGSDYENFEERNYYLAAKLLTIFIENPIIFIGYSLDDKNIQNILTSIVKCLNESNIDKLRDRLIFCQWSEIPVKTTINDSVLLISNTSVPIKLIKTHNFIDIYTVLANNKKRLPIKVLRQMKGMVYDYVKSNDSNQKIYVMDNLDAIEDIHKAEFVWGIGITEKIAQKGITGIELTDLLKDIVFDDGENWEPSVISRFALPKIGTMAIYIPYFKYLRSANLLNQNNEIDNDTEIIEFTPNFVEKVNSIRHENFYPSVSYVKKADDINQDCATFSDLLEKCDGNHLHVLMYTPLLDIEKIDPQELRNYLSDNFDVLNVKKNITQFRKLVCLYDYLKYKLER